MRYITPGKFVRDPFASDSSDDDNQFRDPWSYVPLVPFSPVNKEKITSTSKTATSLDLKRHCSWQNEHPFNSTPENREKMTSTSKKAVKKRSPIKKDTPITKWFPIKKKAVKKDSYNKVKYENTVSPIIHHRSRCLYNKLWICIPCSRGRSAPSV